MAVSVTTPQIKNSAGCQCNRRESRPLTYSRLNRALAIANLLNLGFSPQDSFKISTAWLVRQSEQSTSRIDELVRRTRVENKVQSDGGRMFASFHHSMYPFLYRALSEGKSHNSVVSLIGEQNEAAQSALVQLGRTYGCEIEFVKSDSKMIRKLHKRLREGVNGLLLVDIPWAKGEKTLDVEYAIRGGAFLGKSSLQRLLSLIDSDYSFLYARRVESGIEINELGHSTIADAYVEFGKRLWDDPADYERLSKFHNFFRFSDPSRYAVTFRIKDESFLLYTMTMKAWKVTALESAHSTTSDTLETSGNSIAWANSIVNDDVTAVLSI